MKIDMENSLEKINNAALKFLTPLTPQATYKTIVEEALKIVDGDEGVVSLKTKEGFKIVYAYHTKEYVRFKSRKRGFSYRAIKEKRAFVVHADELQKIHPDIVRFGVKSSIFIPLLYRNKGIGVLILQSHRDRYFTNQAELNALKLFGSFASLAIRKMQLYGEAKQSLEIRDLFISMAAHELRTPITAINGYTQLLKSKVTPDSFPYYKWLEELSWEVIRLTLLVNELLEINKVRDGQLHYTFRECTIREIIRRAINNIGFVYPHRKIVVEDNDEKVDDIIIADFDKLMQVIINILKNAARFSPPSSSITIFLHFTKSYCIIRITDKGKGISKEDKKRVFEKYYKGKNTAEEGMGIGLYLAKNIVMLHHGTLVIDSEVNTGTVVTMKLPLRKI